MKIIIAGGTGFIGKAMVRRYLTKHHSVTVLGRSREKIKRIFGDGVTAMDWLQLKSQGADALRPFDLIINLAGATIGEKRWTQRRKQEILDSRLTTTSTLAALCANLGHESPPLFNTSAIGVYGLQPTASQGMMITRRHSPLLRE